MFYFMTLSFIIMPALGCFLIGLAFAKPDRWDFSWILSLIGLAAFISSFWHIARVDLWFMLSYSVGPFLMGFGFSWDLSKKRRRQLLLLGAFFLIFFVILYYLIVRILNTAVV
ncbi:hypothetical protein CQA85_07855 [Streptococcus salivarius]|uniref:hypothetical protein n=1 Tax=Streptococcus salivarius TaxID=1304 RepID=UPI000BD953B5|nr:hypothetical protein [Streptococcus salivarius]PCR82421.1 hypothetical protein CQA85_07855 [Streptococcus salivarius]